MRFEPEVFTAMRIARSLMEKVKETLPWIRYGNLWTLASALSGSVLCHGNQNDVLIC